MYLSRIQDEYVLCALHFASFLLCFKTRVAHNGQHTGSGPSIIDQIDILTEPWHHITQSPSLQCLYTVLTQYRTRQEELLLHYRLIFHTLTQTAQHESTLHTCTSPLSQGPMDTHHTNQVPEVTDSRPISSPAESHLSVTYGVYLKELKLEYDYTTANGASAALQPHDILS